MNILDSLKKALAVSAKTKREIAESVGMTEQGTGRTMKSPGIKAETAIRLLNAMGFNVYTVPKSIHISLIFDDAIEITPDTKESRD